MLHRCTPRTLLLTAFFLTGATLKAAETSRHPLVAGFERFYSGPKASKVQGGQLLLTELNCVSCHQPADPLLTRKQAPVLDTVAERVRLGYLRKFLRDPQKLKPGTTMPNVLAGGAGKDEKIDALVHFLACTGGLRHEAPKNQLVAPGKDLYHKAGCVACHGTRNAAGLPEKVGPTSVPLGDLKAKYSIPTLAAFLENPHKARPAGRMPRLLQGEDAKKVATYLLQGIKVHLPTGKGATTYAYYEGAWDRLPDFSKLKPAASGVSAAFDLGVAKRNNDFGIAFEGYFPLERAGNYRFTLGSDDGSKLLIDGKQVVDNDGVHAPHTVSGSVQLAKGIHKATVLFFQVGGGVELTVEIAGPGLGQQPLGNLTATSEQALKKKPAKIKPKEDEDAIDLQPVLVEKGKILFASLGCASCHTMTVDKKPLASTFKAPPLAQLKPEAGCLAAKPAQNVPHYELSNTQREALAAALKRGKPLSKEPAAVVCRTFTTFNCYACHVRDKLGGPEEELNRFFQTTQPEMGDEGRVPPPLDGVGGKLTLDYLKQILENGSHDRPYMHTRMPAFGLGNVGTLVEALTALDKPAKVSPVKLPWPAARVKAAGRQMVGEQAFGCIKCHTFAGHKAEGVQGMDMTILTRRLRREWFHSYLLDPQKVRPGTRMPAAWPEGKSLLTEILDGKAATQVEAIWVYLQDGGGAQLPVGLNKHSIPLTPDKNAIIYRNFIQGAGPRAIGVGYPEGVHLAFDANGMRLALLWQGAFIDASRHWTDRGAGFEGPLGDNILALPAGASFAVLDKNDAAWPTKPPKEMGYKFKGYKLTPDDRPTFRYTFGDVKIEDFPNPAAGKEAALRRTLKLSAAKSVDNLYFRAAVANKIQTLGRGWYRLDDWKMKIKSATPPQVRQSAGKAELLVPVRFAKGKAEIVQVFAW
jgi:mono/diheme cytochrome c family protein